MYLTSDASEVPSVSPGSSTSGVDGGTDGGTDPAPAPGAEGFGAKTAGGTGQPACVVSSLADTGANTLRSCLATGHRNITFSVGGTINVASTLAVAGPFVTIDGSSAPAPGITIRHAGMNTAVLSVRGDAGAHDVIVRGLRIRGPYTREYNVDTSNDGIAVSRGAYNILIDHVSISGMSDGAL